MNDYDKNKLSMNDIESSVELVNNGQEVAKNMVEEDSDSLNILRSINKFNIEETPNSSFNIFLGKRRSGKSILAEYYLNSLIKAKKIDMAFLLSETLNGFDNIEPENKFTDIEVLHNIIENFKKMNQYNKVSKVRDQIKLNVMIIIDDMAVKLKNKEFNILENLATNGRHFAYKPLSLHFCILSQSLTKIPRVVRLNSDQIFLNMIASSREKEMVLDENFYLIKSDIAGKRQARKLYEDLVMDKDYQFIVIENYKQNIRNYNDYIKTYRAVIK